MKKILLSFGTISTISIPIFSIVACSGVSDHSDDKEKDFVYNLVSMGVTASNPKMIHPQKSKLDQDAIDMYKLQNINNQKIVFDGNYTYEYTATLKTIKIYIERKDDKKIQLVKEMPISKNSFKGHFSSNEKLREFLAITDEVKKEAFIDEKLTSLSLPEVVTIDEDAFYSSELISLDLPNVKTIGISSFGTAQLKSLNLPKLTSVGESAFFSSELTSLNLPKVTFIGENVFSSAKLDSLDLPNAKTISAHAFQASELTSLKIPNINSIGIDAFACSELTLLNLPKNLKANVEKNHIFSSKVSITYT